jgi:hypothetical protein
MQNTDNLELIQDPHHTRVIRNPIQVSVHNGRVKGYTEWNNDKQFRRYQRIADGYGNVYTVDEGLSVKNIHPKHQYVDNIEPIHTRAHPLYTNQVGVRHAVDQFEQRAPRFIQVWTGDDFFFWPKIPSHAYKDPLPNTAADMSLPGAVPARHPSHVPIQTELTTYYDLSYATVAPVAHHVPSQPCISAAVNMQIN